MSTPMLTTFDNPWNPFTNFNEWLIYDSQNGYNSCGLLARIARTSEQFSDEENEQEIERAIDEIIRIDFLNIYRKVYAETFDLKETKEKAQNFLKELNSLEKSGTPD